VKEEYKKEFLAGLLMFRHPVVFDPIKACCRIAGLSQEDGENGDPELRLHEPYAALLDDPKKREEVIGSIIPSPLVAYIAEGFISPRTHQPREDLEIPDYVYRDLKLTPPLRPSNQSDKMPGKTKSRLSTPRQQAIDLLDKEDGMSKKDGKRSLDSKNGDNPSEAKRTCSS